MIIDMRGTSILDQGDLQILFAFGAARYALRISLNVCLA